MEFGQFWLCKKRSSSTQKFIKGYKLALEEMLNLFQISNDEPIFGRRMSCIQLIIITTTIIIIIIFSKGSDILLEEFTYKVSRILTPAPEKFTESAEIFNVQ